MPDKNILELEAQGKQKEVLTGRIENPFTGVVIIANSH